MLLAPSITSLNLLDGLYGDRRICVDMISLTDLNSASKIGVHVNFAIPAVAFLRFGMLRGRDGTKFEDWPAFHRTLVPHLCRLVSSVL